MKIKTQEIARLYESYEYDLGDKELPNDWEGMHNDSKLLWLNRNCLDCNRVDWEYADGGTLDDYEIIE